MFQLAYQPVAVVDAALGVPNRVESTDDDPKLVGGMSRSYGPLRDWEIEVVFVQDRAVWFTLVFERMTPPASPAEALARIGMTSDGLQLTSTGPNNRDWAGTVNGVSFTEVRVNTDGKPGRWINANAILAF